jgi:hypothetical protein
MFPSSRLLFSRFFGLKVFRLCIYEIQGITVSTTHIETFIDKNFQDDLLGMIDIATDSADKTKGKLRSVLYFILLCIFEQSFIIL